MYTDRGCTSTQRFGKELCDLLVVFGEDVLLFSDKSCVVKSTGNLCVDWNRWYTRAIVKSSAQLYGAERWIRIFPHRIFLDPYCTKPFPFDLPSSERMRVHRVAVARGAKQASKEFYGGGSGSLRISTATYPVMNDNSFEEQLKAFTIGYADRRLGYIHVFDDVTLDIVMSELDTISDFCEYLTKKERFIGGRAVMAAGEEELVAFYRRLNEEQRHDFVLENRVDGIAFDEGFWDARLSNPQYLAKKEADKVSYIWDRLIEHFNRNYLSGNLLVPVPARDYEKAIRIMASVGRVERRAMGRKLPEILQTTGAEQMRFSVVGWSARPDIVFVFFLFPPHPDKSYREYQEVRVRLLQSYCGIFRMKHPQIREIVGIATEPHKSGRGRTETLAYFDFSNWTDAQEAQAKEDQEKFGFLTSPEITYFREREYPEPEERASARAKGGGWPNRQERRRRAALERRKER